jgi:hypothetical protein
MENIKDRGSLADKFDRHVEEEGKVLDEYRVLSEKSGDGPVGFLIDLILTEEEQHHFLLRTMARWLRESPAAGESGGVEGGNRAEILRYTQRLRKHEQETIEAFRDLKPQLPREDGDLLESLLDVMILDSQKHHRLLLVVEKMIQA